MIKRIALTTSALAVLAAAANAQSPFGTFNSVAQQGIALSGVRGAVGDSGTLTGLGSTGYTFVTQFGTFNDVTYTFDALDFTVGTAENPPTSRFSAGVLGPGSIVFSNAGNSNILTIDFDSAELDLTNFTAFDEQGDNVVFSGTVGDQINAAAADNDNDGFDFSFSNQTPAGTPVPNDVSYRTSFSVSAAPVPEPTTMAALGLGAVAMLRRRRKA